MFQSKYKTFHSRKCIWKCRLRNGGHFVQGKMSFNSLTDRKGERNAVSCRHLCNAKMRAKTIFIPLWSKKNVDSILQFYPEHLHMWCGQTNGRRHLRAQNWCLNSSANTMGIYRYNPSSGGNESHFSLCVLPIGYLWSTGNDAGIVLATDIWDWNKHSAPCSGISCTDENRNGI